MKVRIALFALLLPSAVAAQAPTRVAVIAAATDIRITPARLEIVSESRGMIGDTKTWLPLAIDFASSIGVGQQEGVEAAAHAFIVAFNNLDMPAFLNCFAEDATVFHPPAAPPRTFPTRLQGRREIERTFQVVFDLIRGGRTSPPYQDLQPRDLLLQQFGESAVLTFHLGTAPRTSRRTLVFRRIGAGWKIAHLHASTFDVAQ